MPGKLLRPVGVIKELNDPYAVATTSSGAELVVSQDHKISIIGETIRSIDTRSVRSRIRRFKLDPWGVHVASDEHSSMWNHLLWKNGEISWW